MTTAEKHSEETIQSAHPDDDSLFFISNMGVVVKKRKKNVNL